MKRTNKAPSKTPHIVDVEIKKEGFLEQTITVRPIWSDVDRNDFAWGLRSSDDKVAQRLKAALMAGKVYSGIEVLTDVSGKTFVSALAAVRGRCLDADLRSIGF